MTTCLHLIMVHVPVNSVNILGLLEEKLLFMILDGKMGWGRVSATMLVRPALGSVKEEAASLLEPHPQDPHLQ